MTRSQIAVFVFLATLSTSSGAGPTADTIEELKACARITEQEARFACYDELGKRVLRQETAESNPAQESPLQTEAQTATTTVVEPLPDDLGSKNEIQYAASVTSCKQGLHGDWFFFFENGQVWKQVNNRNIRFKECEFDVTITKDRFGYKMRIDAEDRTIRVKRNR
ncbi:MAG: hypothetical protein QNI98_03225 [Woeseiaceae bacterium]|nr:hypothetical protein [Woeseiaceae bacterium]